jgi:membrane protein implicated in regulation of membrane protease activity
MSTLQYDGRFRPVAIAACAGLLVTALPVGAYVGPGAGLSLIGALWALVLALFSALFFVVAWPLRRMLRRRDRAAATDDAGMDAGASCDTSSPQADPQSRGRVADRRSHP